MPSSRKCHKVASHCRVDSRMKKSGNCTKNGRSGTIVKTTYRPKKSCDRAATSIAAIWRGRLSRKASRTVNSGSKKKKKKMSVQKLMSITKASKHFGKKKKKSSKK